MRLASPRITPLEEKDWSPDARAELGRMAEAGRVYNIFKTLARYPKLLKRWLVFGNHVLAKSTLPARDRELLILRTGWRCRAPYEWAQHVLIGRAVARKLRAREIESVALCLINAHMNPAHERRAREILLEELPPTNGRRVCFLEAPDGVQIEVIEKA
jgi:alkylhydroperoxidase family enzyme